MNELCSDVKKSLRQQQKEATRLSIKEAARECLLEKGYQHTSITDIANKCGIAVGTFYVHFDSKESVLDVLFSEFNNELIAKIQPILQEISIKPMPTIIESIAHCFLDYWCGQKGIAECYAQSVQGHYSIESMRDGVNPPAIHLLTKVIRDKAIQQGVPDRHWGLVVHAIGAMWLRVGLQYLFNSEITKVDAVTTLVDLTLGSLGFVLPGIGLDSEANQFSQ